MATASLLGTLGRWLLFTGTLLWLGAATVRWVVLPAWALRPRPGEPLRGAILRSAAGTGVLGGLLLLAGTLSRLQMQVADFVEPFEPAGPQVRLLVTQTFWGRVWIFQAVVVVVGMVAFLACRHGGRKIAWAVGGASAVAAGIVPALSGHAVATEGAAALAVMADAAHVLAAGAWLGTLSVIVATVATRHAWWGDPLVRDQLSDLVHVFSPVALTCAAIIATTGLLAAWLHVTPATALVTSGYGRTLLLKIGGVVVVMTIGAFNWRRVKPALAEPEAPRRVLRSAGLELTFACLVVLVTSVLVVTPPPSGP